MMMRESVGSGIGPSAVACVCVTVGRVGSLVTVEGVVRLVGGPFM